jgi:PPOX class probable F420-dependent enzyme
MELEKALTFARDHRQAILTTIRSNGRPQQSNVLYVVFGDGLIRISITTDRAKYRNLTREPWAALHISRQDFFAYVVIEGNVELSPVASRPDDATVDELVEYYRIGSGEHEDWDAFRQSMVDDHRVMVRLTPVRAYGML